MFVASKRQTNLPIQCDAEILCHQVLVLEQYHEIHLKLDAEVGGLRSRACEQAREDDVHGNGQPTAHVTVGELQIQDLRRCTTRMHTTRSHVRPKPTATHTARTFACFAFGVSWRT